MSYSKGSESPAPAGRTKGGQGFPPIQGAGDHPLFEAANDAVFIHDMKTGAILEVNGMMCSLFGYSREEACRLTVGDISLGSPPYSQEDALRRIRRAAAGEPQVFEWRCRDKNGRLFWAEVSLKSAVLGGRKCVLAILRDVEERKRLEEGIRQAQKMEAVGRLAGGIAHDFNNLLTAIIGYCNVAMKEMPHEDPWRRTIVMIDEAARRAAGLTRRLLTMSRKQVLSVTVLDLNEIVSGMKEMLESLAGERIEVSLELDPALGKTAADRSQIEQIVTNLAVNACEAMRGGGRITIQTADVDLDAVYARTRPDVESGPYVLFSLSDTGCGMDQETCSRIFEPFFTTKGGKGTGLGLSTVYGIVRSHGGHVSVYSEPGLGTTFKIYLPRITGEPAEEGRGRGRPGNLVGSETVLLVEDEALVRKVAKRILEMHGYTVLMAADPEEALALSESREGAIDLLLTDVIMPGMDGPALYERLSPSRPEMKVLFMSGHAERAVLDQGMPGFTGNFLPKPFTADGLAEKVRKVLDERGEGGKPGGG